MGIRFLEGRDFNRMGVKEDAKNAIVNRKFAEHFFPGKSAIGKRLGRGSGPQTKYDVEIVGVVEDSLYEGPREGVRRQVFWPGWGRGSVTFYVRTTEASSSAFNMIRSEMKRLDGAMPVYDVKTVQGQLDETLLTDRLIALLSAGFGLLATILASVGLYGVMAYMVQQRGQEIGIRMALGADRWRVLRMILRESAVLVFVGVAAGAALAYFASRYTESLLFGLKPNDPMTLVLSVVGLAFIGATASAIPAWRAARVEPTTALRE